MKILVIGGTLFFGIDLVEQLILDGHEVTLATRGNRDEVFKDRAEFITLDRHNLNTINLRDRKFDVIIDKIACCSNDFNGFSQKVDCNKYILMSTAGVYIPQHLNSKEEEFSPLKHDLVWLNRSDVDYHEAKRQAEIALFNNFNECKPISVRYPVVLGRKDYTKRLEFFVKNLVYGNAMYIDNLDAQMPFICNSDAGKFMATLVKSEYVGALNGASVGTISIAEIIKYIETRIGKKVILDENGEKSPFNGTPEYSLDISEAEKQGYRFKKIEDWIFDLIDYYIWEIRKC